MHAAVFDADGVDAHLLRYELDAVLTGAEVLDVADLRHARRTRHRRLHVVPVRTYDKHRAQVRQRCGYTKNNRCRLRNNLFHISVKKYTSLNALTCKQDRIIKTKIKNFPG